jgi:aspartyl/asparaginyl beta-hydroxylase (cupin superfamily)
VRSLYGNAGFRAFLTLLSLQVLLFGGLTAAALSFPSSSVDGLRVPAWIAVTAAAVFLATTWSLLGEAALCLGYYWWKPHSLLLRTVVLLAPAAFVSGDLLLNLGASSTLARLPLLCVGAAGVFVSGAVLCLTLYIKLRLRWREHVKDNLVADATRKFGEQATRRLVESISFHRDVNRHNPFQMRRGLHLTDLPSRARWADADFPWTSAFTKAFADIRAEAQFVCANEPLGDYTYPTLVRGRWNSFFLVKRNQVDPRAERLCPATVRALRHVPCFPHMTEAFFSVLQPGARIMPHCDDSNFWVVAHFALDIPGNCGIRVGREDCRWTEGEFLFFDSSYEHEAWNDSERPRIVLLFDFPNPALNEAELDFLIRQQREFHPPLAPAPALESQA